MVCPFLEPTHDSPSDIGYPLYLSGISFLIYNMKKGQYSNLQLSQIPGLISRDQGVY